MNTKIKIAVAMLAGIIAGAMLVGTAVATPRMMSTPAFDGYGMMRSFDSSGTFNRPTIADMNAFMDRYRAANGAIDVDRMRSDVGSGKVPPPCVGASSRAEGTSKAQGGRTPYRRGLSMMQGLPQNGRATGYGMMGLTY